MEKIFKSFNGFVDRNLGYFDNQLGIHIESTQHLRKVMKERGLEGVRSYDECDRERARKEKYDDQKRHQELKKTILEGAVNSKRVKVSS